MTDIADQQLMVTDPGFDIDYDYSLSTADCETILTLELSSSPSLPAIILDTSTKKIQISQVNDLAYAQDYTVTFVAKFGQ